MDYTKFLPVIIGTTSFISAFAVIAAAIIMAQFIRNFVTGILAAGFKTIGCKNMGDRLERLSRHKSA